MYGGSHELCNDIYIRSIDMYVCLYIYIYIYIGGKKHVRSGGGSHEQPSGHVDWKVDMKDLDSFGKALVQVLIWCFYRMYSL